MVPHPNNIHICLGCEGTVKLEWEYEDMGTQEQMMYDLDQKEKAEGVSWDDKTIGDEWKTDDNDFISKANWNESQKPNQSTEDIKSASELIHKDGWSERHYKIAEDAAEKFKTHRKEDETNI